MIRRGIIIAMIALVAYMAAGATNLVSETAYLAPVNQLIFKVVFPGGGVRELERVLVSPGTLRGADGWHGTMNPDGIVDVFSSDRSHRYRFDRGRLVASIENGESRTYSYDSPRSAPAGVISPLYFSKEDFQEAAKAYSYSEFVHKWDGTGRLAFPFINPNQNGALYGELLILFVWFFVLLRSKILKGVAALLVFLAGVCLFWTMSRGAWLGTGLALMPFMLPQIGRVVKNRWFWLTVAICVAGIAAWIFLFGTGQMLRGFETGGWTNAIRLEIWRRAPLMMFNAPGGWDFFHVGSAYLHWYQPLNVFALTPTLINDHLTWLVGWGWHARFWYVFAVYFAFAVSAVLWRIRGNPLSLSLLTVLFVAAWFNPMMHRIVLWVLPVAGVALAFVSFPWKRARFLVVVGVTSATLAGCTFAGVYYSGKTEAAKNEFVRADSSNGRVMYRDQNPKVWIVDDGLLGGGLAGKDIREFYSVEKSAPGIGYVTSVSSLPSNINKLILSGHAGADWLTLLSENPSARDRLPKTVVFISPPFAPADIPEGVRMMCRVKVLTGEFAALYEPRFYERVDGVDVDIIPGMEQYVLRWMWRIMRY